MHSPEDTKGLSARLMVRFSNGHKNQLMHAGLHKGFAHKISFAFDIKGLVQLHHIKADIT